MDTLTRRALVVLLVAVACQDYDRFQVVGSTGGAGGQGAHGGGPSTGGAGVGASDGGVNGGGGAEQNGGGGSAAETGGGGSMAQTGGGGSTSDGGGGGGGGGSGVLLPCSPIDECDPTINEFCCVSDNGATVGTCKTNCTGSEATLECNEPSDCPGQRCCLELSGDTIDQAHCANTCGELTLCDPSAPADCNGNPCTQSEDLPDGYFVCDAG